MTAYDVLVRISPRKVERAQLCVHGATYPDARRTAAFILDAPEDLVELEVMGR